jgi:hypothetical protein
MHVQSFAQNGGRTAHLGVVVDRNRGPVRPLTCFAEVDYCYGEGPLWMRVERVDWANAVHQDGSIWYEVEGMELTPDGREVGRRRALVRAQRLAAMPTNRRG